MDDADLDRAAAAQPRKRLESYYTILTYFVVTGSIIYCSCLYFDAELALDGSRQFGNDPPVSIGIIYSQIEIRPLIDDEQELETGPPSDTRYILLWTPNFPYNLLQGNFFLDNECPYTNCYVTVNRSYFPSHGDFDAILFTRSIADDAKYIESLPTNRHPWQKYIFATLETSCSLPIANPMFDHLYNFTWTNRLRSEIYWSKFGIYDKNLTRIGPAIKMKWPKTDDPASEHIQKILRGKTKLAAWITDWKYSESEKFVYFLNKELARNNLTIDIFGTCGKPTCTNATILKMLKRDYYFYLSFEDTFEEDYVTENLLIALSNTVVPIVYGGANYSRFLPPGSYIDALKLGPEKLADTMISIVKNKTLYYEFFRWTNYLTYKASDTKTEMCNFCTSLNNQEKLLKKSVYPNFCKWWNGRFKRDTCEPRPEVKAIFKDNTLIVNVTSENQLTREVMLTVSNNLDEGLVAELDYELHPIFVSDPSLLNGTLTNETSIRDKYIVVESTVLNNNSTSSNFTSKSSILDTSFTLNYTTELFLDSNFTSKSSILDTSFTLNSTTELFLDSNFTCKSILDTSFTLNSLILGSNFTAGSSILGNFTTESTVLDIDLTESLIFKRITNNSSLTHKNLTNSLIG